MCRVEAYVWMRPVRGSAGSSLGTRNAERPDMENARLYEQKGHENLKSPFAVFASETDGLSGLNSSAANGDSWLDSLHVVIQTHGYPARFIGLSVF